MRAVWKFELPATAFPVQTIEMPVGAHVLTADVQNGHGLCLWAIVETTAPLEARKVWTVGTGHDITGILPHWHVGTVQLMNGLIVLHVFVENR